MTIPRYLPNLLTVIRIPLAIVFFALALAGGPYGEHSLGLRWAAAVLFIAAMATDWVDGYLARRFALVSDFGKLWDPIADKLLTGAAFIALAILGETWWWLVIVVLIREWGITAHRFMVRRTHEVAAAWMGKVKTAAQGLALSWALLPCWLWVGIGPAHTVTNVLMLIVLALTVASGVDYVAAQTRAARR